MRVGALFAGGLGLGCTPAPAADRAPDSASAVSVPVIADSLIATGPGGTEVWFTLARTDRGPGSVTCRDRTIEFRHGATRTPVPLLYTEQAPRFVDDSTVEAVLYLACRPVARYLVNVRSGQPTPLRP